MRVCFKIVLCSFCSQAPKFISMAKNVSPYQHSWSELTSSQRRGISAPGFTLKSACKHCFLDPGLLHHWVTPLVCKWRVVLGNSTTAGRRQCCCCLCRLHWCLALNQSLEVTACLTTLGSSSQEQTHTMGRAEWRFCTLPSPMWTCKHGDCLPVSPVGALFTWRNGLGCDEIFFFWQVFPRRMTSPHKLCQGELISLFQLWLNCICCVAVNTFFMLLIFNSSSHIFCFLS